MIKNKLIILFCVCLMWSCRPETDISPFLTSDSLIDHVENGMVKIGQKLDNPYSVVNMSKAYQNLLESDENGRVSQENYDVRTTHLYIKFKPESDEELDILNSDSTLMLYSYPLDYVLY